MTATATPDVLAVIPARGGSKGVPRKNVRLLGGKPLVAWTIEAALAATQVDRVIVSTEDEDIAEIARRWGAEVPFQRPMEFAQDETPGIDPTLHALQWLETHEQYRPEYVLVLQPTSPLRTAGDIDAAIRLAQDRQADSVISVCPALHHPYWMKRLTADGRLVDWLSEQPRYERRQDLPPLYALDGAIFLGRTEVVLAQRSFYTDRTYAYVTPLERSLDIDTPWDLHVAELVLKNQPSG